jgi:phage shock protein A
MALGRAIGNWFKSWSLFWAGIFGRSAKARLGTAEAVEATYDEALAKEKEGFSNFRSGVAMQVKNKMKDETQATTLEAQLVQQKRRLTGAKNIVQEEVQRLVASGKTVDEAKAMIPMSDKPLVREAYTAFTNLSGNITRDTKSLEDLKVRITDAAKQIEDYRLQGQQIHARIKDIERRKGQKIAELTSAQSRKQANEAMAGVGTTGTAELLASVDDVVAQAVAEAQVSDTMTGMDSERAAAKFDLAAETAEAHNALFDGMDFGDKTTASGSTGEKKDGTKAAPTPAVDEDPMAS